METSILSGLEASKALYSSLEDRINHLKQNGIVPGLAAVLVGNNPASEIYVKNKTKKFESLGLKTDVFRLEEAIAEDELLSLISKLNNDSEFHGILVQLPLPKHIDSEKVLNAIIPTKDVDGFHPENAGLLSIGKPRFVPCTPKGIMFILKHFKIDLILNKLLCHLKRNNLVSNRALTNKKYQDNLYRKDVISVYETQGLKFKGTIVGMNDLGLLLVRKKNDKIVKFNLKEIKMIP